LARRSKLKLGIGKKMRTVYVASLVVGMVTWLWALSTGIVWIFGA